MKQKSSSTRNHMKHFATAALMLNLGVASVYAQERPIRGSFSGTSGLTMANLAQFNAEYQFAGHGMSGQFTFRAITGSNGSMSPVSGCAISGTAVAGGGVFRFDDGSLLMVNLTDGTDCINPPTAQCVRNFKVTAGTGRFKHVSQGTKITFAFTVLPVVDGLSAILDGELTGTTSGGN
jgi:hypothetical protein